MRHSLASAFAHFDGAKADNPVWGWSAITADRSSVVLTIWRDQVLPDGSVDFYDHPKLVLWRNARGNKSRIAHLKAARDECDGLFRVVWVTAKDPKAHPRSIAAREPDPMLVMRLTALNEQTGEFRATPVC